MTVNEQQRTGIPSEALDPKTGRKPAPRHNADPDVTLSNGDSVNYAEDKVFSSDSKTNVQVQPIVISPSTDFEENNNSLKQLSTICSPMTAPSALPQPVRTSTTNPILSSMHVVSSDAGVMVDRLLEPSAHYSLSLNPFKLARRVTCTSTASCGRSDGTLPESILIDGDPDIAVTSDKSTANSSINYQLADIELRSTQSSACWSSASTRQLPPPKTSCQLIKSTRRLTMQPTLLMDSGHQQNMKRRLNAPDCDWSNRSLDDPHR